MTSHRRVAPVRHRSVVPVVSLLVAGALALVACGSDGSSSIQLSPAATAGRQVAIQKGCASCHGNDGEGRVAPPFQGLFGSTVEFQDGTSTVADEAYIIESIVDPNARQVEGYNLPMPQSNLTDEEIASIVDYIRELADTGDTAEEAAP